MLKSDNLFDSAHRRRSPILRRDRRHHAQLDERWGVLPRPFF
jgi:hypothetical protein